MPSPLTVEAPPILLGDTLDYSGTLPQTIGPTQKHPAFHVITFFDHFICSYTIPVLFSLRPLLKHLECQISSHPTG